MSHNVKRGRFERWRDYAIGIIKFKTKEKFKHIYMDYSKRILGFGT